jgi:hypothetical protein
MERVEALQHSRKEHVQEAVNGLRRDLVAVMPQVRPSGGGDEDEREDDGMDAEDMLEAYSQWTEWCDAAGASADGACCCPHVALGAVSPDGRNLVGALLRAAAGTVPPSRRR